MPYGKGVGRFVPSMTYQPVSHVINLLKGTEDLLVVDLGAGGRKIVPWIKTVDAVSLPGTDVICDFSREQTPFQKETVDIVISTGVLEHVADDHRYMAEICRILKPGGLLHIELPFLQQYHEDPIDCRRLTAPGLKLYLEQNGFEVITYGVHIGPTVTILTLLSYYIDLLFTGRSFLSRAIGHAGFIAFSIIAWPLRYLDLWLIHKPAAHRLAFGVYSTARKLHST